MARTAPERISGFVNACLHRGRQLRQGPGNVAEFRSGGHWFSKLFWAGMVLSILMEVILLAQTIEYGHAEHAPHLSRAVWTAAVLAGLLATMTLWWVVRGTFSDPLFLMSLGLVTAAYPPMGLALFLHRRGRAGQTPLMWGAFTALVVLWYPSTAYGFGSQFRSWPWLGLGALTVAWAAVNTWLVLRAPSPAAESRPGAAGTPEAQRQMGT